MFRSRHLYFASIPCPEYKKTRKCPLPNCIFSHELATGSVEEPGARNGTGKRTIDEVVSSREPETVEKRPKRNSPSDLGQKQVSGATQNVQKIIPATFVKEPTSKPASPAPTTLPEAETAAASSAPAKKTVPASERKDALNLVPVPVTPFAPCPHQQRIKYLQAICKELELKNVRFPKRIAMKLEHNIAKSTSKVIYPNHIRKLVADIKADKFGKAGQQKAEAERKAKEEKLQEQLRKELVSLVIRPSMLQSNDYVVGLVIPKPLEPDYMATCERCGCTFKVSNGDTTTQSTCYYHWARLPYDFINKKRSNVYPCCSQLADQGAGGCTKSTQHVYKMSLPQHMASVIQFVPTPPPSPTQGEYSKLLFAAGIDCEMGYTSHGVELIRVTVVDWDTGKTVLDRTVYPVGTVIDLNTRFSGVSSLDDGVKLDDGTHHPTISFTQARAALFEYVSSETILIGHGLENDLNALRLLHTNVVDTAIRYPTLNERRKHSLKSLAHTYLGRTIQTGEHDSAEDALAAMDIVKANIKKHLPL